MRTVPDTIAGNTSRLLSHSYETRINQLRKPKIPTTSTMPDTIQPRRLERKLRSPSIGKNRGPLRRFRALQKAGYPQITELLSADYTDVLLGDPAEQKEIVTRREQQQDKDLLAHA